MLTLSRVEGSQVVIGDNIVVTVVRVNRRSVLLGFEAPKEIRILRSELLDREDDEQEAA